MGNVQIYRHAPLESNELESALTITLSIQSSSSAMYGTNGDYTLRWSGNASSPNSSVVITEVNSNGEFTVTFGANSGLGILWIDAMDDELVEETETVNFTIVSQPNYNVKAFQETAIIRIQDVSPTAAFANLSTVTSNFLEGTSGDYGIWVNGLNPNHGVTLDVQVGGSSSSQLGLASANGDYYFEWIVGETTETITTVDDDGQIHLALPAGVSSGILRVKTNLDDYYEPTETTPITLNILTSSTYRAVPLARKSFCIEDRVWGEMSICKRDVNIVGTGPSSFTGHAYWAIEIFDWNILRTEINTAYPDLGLNTSVSSYERGWGYYPSDMSTPLNCDGILLSSISNTGSAGYQTKANASESHTVKVYSRSRMKMLLDFTEALRSSPGTYNLVNNNCVSQARNAAVTVGLSFPNGSMSMLPYGLEQDIIAHEQECDVCHKPDV